MGEGGAVFVTPNSLVIESVCACSGSLDEVELAALESALTQLRRSGHQWVDPMTQCVLQRLVNYFQTGYQLFYF